MKVDVDEQGEITELRLRLAEAEATLRAIRRGDADAILDEASGVFHLKGAEKPYITFFSTMNEGGVTLDGQGAILNCNPRFVAMIGRSIDALRGQPFLVCVGACDRARVIDFLNCQEATTCEAELETGHAPLPVRLSIKKIVTAAQQFSCLVVTDLSDYVRVENELRQREHDLRAILDHVPSMIGYWDRTLRNRFGNHAYRTWFGVDPEQMSGITMREVIGETLFQLNRPYIEGVLRGEHQVFERCIPIPGGEGVRFAQSHYIPDVVDGEVQGFYVLVTDISKAKANETSIRDSEERLRAMYANQHAVIEAERKHVAREVHDELGQILTALRMETSLLQTELRGRHKSLSRVMEMRLLIEAMFKSVRNIAGDLRPSTLDLGLIPAIEWLAVDFEKRWGIDCALDIDMQDIQASDAYATGVFRVIQESLTNVARHAQASQVSISLRQYEDHLTLEIHDNGKGFVHDEHKRQGFGLIGMRERVLELGGSLSIQSVLGQGTEILIDLPLTQGAR